MIPALVQMSNRWCPEPKINHWPSWQSTIRARNELLRCPTASSGENDGLTVKRVKPWNVGVPTLRHNFLTSYWKLLHALQGMADPLQYSYSRTVEAHKCHCLALWPNIRFKKKITQLFWGPLIHHDTPIHTHTRNKKQSAVSPASQSKGRVDTW